MIFGISSFVGSNFAEVLSKKYRIIGTYFETRVNVPGILCMKCDILNKAQVHGLIGAFKPDITIYACGVSSIMACHLDVKLADSLNSAGVINVASSSERFGAQFIYLSSALVMAGEDVAYKEGDTPFPITSFGVTVSQSEFYIQKSCLNYLILRCGKLYGRSHSQKNINWFEAIEKKVESAGVIGADDELRIGFMDVQLCAHYVDRLIETEITNKLMHLSTQDTCSHFEFTQKILKAMYPDFNSLVKKDWPLPFDENQLKLAKPIEQYKFLLDNSNAELVLEKKMCTIDESVEFTAARFLAS